MTEEYDERDINPEELLSDDELEAIDEATEEATAADDPASWAAFEALLPTLDDATRAALLGDSPDDLRASFEAYVAALEDGAAAEPAPLYEPPSLVPPVRFGGDGQPVVTLGELARLGQPGTRQAYEDALAEAEGRSLPSAADIAQAHIDRRPDPRALPERPIVPWEAFSTEQQTAVVADSLAARFNDRQAREADLEARRTRMAENAAKRR